MAEESKKDVGESPTSKDTEVKTKKKGVISKVWNALFRSCGDDFEKRLQHITKEEVSVLARIRRRSQRWRWIARNLIILSVLSEAFAVGYAILTTRSLELDWKMRALRVLPMFLIPALSFISYSTIGSFTRMCDQKDERTLEKLRTERQAKIDELKEKTNYYTTQQLIQRYDPDPAAKAAAASVLASKLGADSGLSVYFGDGHKMDSPTGKSNDIELARTSGLRNRKTPHAKYEGPESATVYHPEEAMLNQAELDGLDDISGQHQLVVEHRPQIGGNSSDGGWFARIAALLVGEDPTQSYALICGNCHMHNGLARKEDFPYITYYCPHCKALNRPKRVDENVSSGLNSPEPSGLNSPKLSGLNSTKLTAVDNAEVVASGGGSIVETAPASSTPVAAAAEMTTEGS